MLKEAIAQLELQHGDAAAYFAEMLKRRLRGEIDHKYLADKFVKRWGPEYQKALHKFVRGHLFISQTMTLQTWIELDSSREGRAEIWNERQVADTVLMFESFAGQKIDGLDSVIMVYIKARIWCSRKDLKTAFEHDRTKVEARREYENRVHGWNW